MTAWTGIKAAGLSMLLAMEPAAESGLIVEAAWVRAMPPGLETTAAYMSLHNSTSRQLVVRKVSSPQFESASLHQTRLSDGVARMIPLRTLALPAGEIVALEPGGYHIMLNRSLSELTGKTEIELSLLLDDGGRVDLTVPVRRSAP
jgi:copper(I)-binding protein